MNETDFEQGERSMVEWPEGIPETVRGVIERVYPDKIKSVQVEWDENKRVKTIIVRRENMVFMSQGRGVGSNDPTYNTTITYSVEYDGESPSRVHLRTEYDGSQGEGAKLEQIGYGGGQPLEDTIEL